ncbi:MAG: hypothetical protein OEN22_02435 [Gammaproteobacteria bacterium]|nr:hypothetical protein [Gammaproteobacteria bacterium]
MSIIGLWLPILVSAVVVFAASSVIWMVFKWHNSDYKKTAGEERVREALRGEAPGFYVLPYCMDPAEFKDPEVQQKFKDGPLGYITIVANGLPKMGGKLVSMFIYFLLVGVLCAYFVSRTLAPDAEYLAVFRVAGTVAFIANGIALIPESVWFGRPWSMTAKSLLDALIYGLLTGGVFGWLA